jgi:hypothetical protein
VTLADGAFDGIDNLPALYADDSSSARDTTTTGSTSLSSADAAPFDSPLGFLRAAFPHIEGAALAAALATACGDADADVGADVDMEAVVGELLSAEYIRELAERGLDPDAVPDDSPWVTVGTQRAPAPRKPKPLKPRATSLTDVRQAHHRRAPTAMRPAPDPWIQVQSLAARLTELLPDHSPGFFASYFHSPAHATPAAAVRAALGTLAGDAAQAELPQELLPTYFALFELLSAEEAFAALDPPRRACVLEDAQLVLAAGAAPDAALDVVHLLRDLDDDDAASGVLGMYHSPAPTPPPSPALSRAAAAGVPPPLTHPPPALLPAPPPAPPAKKHAGGWQHVPERKAARGPSAYASHIPAYQPLYSAAGSRAGGNAAGKGGKGDLGEIRARRKVADLQRRRDAALREATRAWSNGSVRNRGGDVAFFFAERVRIRCRAGAWRTRLTTCAGTRVPGGREARAAQRGAQYGRGAPPAGQARRRPARGDGERGRRDRPRDPAAGAVLARCARPRARCNSR